MKSAQLKLETIILLDPLKNLYKDYGSQRDMY
jgi:hypothetical protein